MQRENTTPNETTAMSGSGISGVFFEDFSSKNGHELPPTNSCRQDCSIDFAHCSFTGKERDEETGYGYFGARYMDHELMTMWLSVDPMADKYPSISPYAYCAWNPVKLVDPDGRDIWKLDNLGNVVDHIECNDYDCFHIVNDK
ncbi:MAG: RHS repeat-associated core domain-containing protein, partial [Bacteroidales bacterium]|nr:RHS repeat-associated core domain-containing protein [Bacteroidales bacterium]